MIKRCLLFPALLLLLGQSVFAQDWKIGHRPVGYNPLPVQFLSPSHERVAVYTLTSTIYAWDSDSLATWDSWAELHSFRHLDSLYNYQIHGVPETAEIKSSRYPKGFYFSDPDHGIIFGSWDTLSSRNNYHHYGSWIASAAKGWNDDLTLDDGETLNPAMHTGDTVYMFGSRTHRLLRYDVVRGVWSWLPGFSSLGFQTRSFLCGEMRSDAVGIIAIEDSSSIVHILRTQNAGFSWTETEHFSSAADTVYSLRQDLLGRFWCTRHAGLFVSNDTGSTWTLKYGSNDPILDVGFGTQDVGYGVGTANDYVLKTTDGGEHWFGQRLAHDGPLSQVTGFDSSPFFLANNFEYWKTTNGGGRNKIGVLHFDSRTIALDPTRYRDTNEHTITAYNVGNDTLRVSAISSSNKWALIEPHRFEIAPGDSLGLTVKYYTGRPTLDTAIFDLLTDDPLDTERITVLNIAKTPVLFPTAWMDLQPTEGKPASYYSFGSLLDIGGDSLYVDRIVPLRAGLRVDSIVESRFTLPDPSPTLAARAYIQLPYSSAGPDSAQIVVFSNSLTSPDTILLRWIVQPGLKVRSASSNDLTFSIWPNPSTTEVRVLSSESQSFRVFDAVGRLCREFDSGSETTTRLTVSSWSIPHCGDTTTRNSPIGFVHHVLDYLKPKPIGLFDIYARLKEYIPSFYCFIMLPSGHPVHVGTQRCCVLVGSPTYRPSRFLG